MGRKLRGGEVIELLSDLGGGKTTFVRGLAKGFGSRDQVRSPSFTLVNQYKSEDLTLFHFDFYRLTDPGIIKSELDEILQDADNVVVIEWPKIVENALPTDRLTIQIDSISENRRKFLMTYPSNLSYLLPVET
ncbi:MAG TPA: tRNA (adenosine(37)-N6)-threonylcarbamoyltransferase complex ATPase subunit type 1 TsaE [Candidatus Saccharimonadales bacterium]|nr:tRNA (adenosine(37)-N6)-threonylcarbamoyltransferase complex ATPase subunit type 1 TsaE [Candidatus Saccharimonadales bacterium]